MPHYCILLIGYCLEIAIYIYLRIVNFNILKMELKERLENYLKQGKQDAREIVCEISERYGLGLTTEVNLFDTKEEIDGYSMKKLNILINSNKGRLGIDEIYFIVKNDKSMVFEKAKKNENVFFTDFLLKNEHSLYLNDFLTNKETSTQPVQTVAHFEKSKYEPFTFEDAELFRDRWAVAESGEYPGVYRVVQYNKESVIYFKWTYELAFNILKFEDGTPFGKLKK